MTVKQLLNSLDSYELTEWLAFYKIEEEEIKKIQEKSKNPKSNVGLQDQMKFNLKGYNKNRLKK